MVLDELLNPNRVAMLLAQINSFFFGYFIISKKPKRFIITLIILITTYFIFMTGSRSSMLAFVFSTFLISIIIIHKKRNFVINLFIIVFITSILYAYFSFFHTGIINKYSINNIIKSGGSGRISIWVAIINNILPRFYLFGVGLGGENVIKAVTPFLKIPRGTHNFLLTVITETGIVGFFLYFIFYSYFIKIIFTKYFKVKYIIIPFTMFLTAVITGAGENIFSEVFLWFSIGFSFLIINNYFNSNKACSSAKYK
jgi:O-antigen ligase